MEKVEKWLQSHGDDSLLPCPFCGGKAFTILNTVRCSMCGAQISKENAKERWNKRTAQNDFCELRL